MADWSLMDSEWPNLYDPYQYGPYPFYQEKQPPVPQCLQPQAHPYVSPTSPTLTLLLSSPQHLSPPTLQYNPPPRENPREIRNKAEKQRRDKLNQSISELAAMVPPVVAASRKIDKTGVLRLTAHYLRAHQYVFGDAIAMSSQEITSSSVQALLGLLNGFLLTTTYKGIVVVVSQNVHQYLGYTELELLGQSIINITHEDDRRLLKEQLTPKCQMLGPNGELLVPDEPDGKQKVAEALANEKRQFLIRLKKLGQRSEPSQYVTCHVEGSFRKADRACRGYTRCCQMVRRVRARGDSPCSSGNDIVFIGVVRPTTDTFNNESGLESFRMEYRTRHSIDGEIIQCEQRIALATGYMTHEVNGVNAMNFMHRDDVRWVIIALREMYDQHRLFGESCYRLMTKNGQFIYMRTRGRLDVDKESSSVTSFVCTNTVVDEEEGKYLIKQMKKKFSLLVSDKDDSTETEDIKEATDNKAIAVEDPRQLEKVILHLVTNLPSQSEVSTRSASPDHRDSPALRLCIIPPRKERIVSAIEKIYTVIKHFQTQPKSTPKNTNIDKNICERSGIEITEIDSAISSKTFESIPAIGTHPSSVQYKEIPPLPVPPLAPLSGSVQEFESPVVPLSGRTQEFESPLARSSEPDCKSPLTRLGGRVQEFELPLAPLSCRAKEFESPLPLLSSTAQEFESPLALLIGGAQEFESPLAPLSSRALEFEHSKDLTNPDSVSHSSCTSDVEYISGPEIPIEGYDNLPSVAGSNVSNTYSDDVDPSQIETQMTYHMIISTQKNTEKVADFHTESNTKSVQLLSANKSGVKRPNENEDGIISKKKVVDVTNQVYRREQTSAQDFTSLEKFFDEAILNTQIESAIRSLEQTIDPSFPDLLISQEVQDILGEIDENDEVGPQIDT